MALQPSNNSLNAFEEIFGKSVYQNKVLFQLGAPSPRTLREVAQLMKEATALQFENFDTQHEETLQYGCNAGNTEFVHELAKFLTENYKNPVNSEDLYVNTGSSQGLTNLLSHYFQPGDTIFVGDPTYWILFYVIKKSWNLNIVAIKVDEHGMRVDDLERQLEKMNWRSASERHPFKAGVYIIPTYHNPTTVCMSEDRCRKLVQLARKHDLLVICDDVYNLLTYSAPDCDDSTLAKPPARVFSYDDKSDPNYRGNVVSIGTFSKILAPGLRLGWFEMPHRVRKDFTATLVSSSGNGRNPYTSGVVKAGLKAGLVQNHIKKIRRMYAERMKRAHEMIISTLEKYGVKCTLPRGGIFLWVTLPGGASADKVVELSKEEMSFVTGKGCSFSGGCENGMRVCISYYDPDVLYPAISKFCKYIIEALKGDETKGKN